MQTLSKGVKSEKLIWRSMGNICELEDYLEITTNCKDVYHNILVLRALPSELEFPKAFSKLKEISRPYKWGNILLDNNNFIPTSPNYLSKTRHEWTKFSYLYLKTDVLKEVEKIDDDLTVWSPESKEDWNKLLKFQIEVDTLTKGGPLTSNSLEIRELKLCAYKNMYESGIGKWWCLMKKDKIISAFGLFDDGSDLRLQRVESHPHFRQKGYFKILFLQTMQIEALPKNRNVLVKALGDSEAERIYTKLGFQKIEEIHEVLIRAV